MTETARLVLAVDSSQAVRAERDLRKLEQGGKRVERATDQLGESFRRLAGPLAAFLGTAAIARSAESWTLLSNRLKLVTDSTEELLAAQDAVFKIAQAARQPLEATAELYQRIATNADALNLSASGVASVVDTINKSLAISGTSGASAAAALTQLGQAFASGTLRGEELNSVLEQAPALAKTLADGLGVTVGELRTLGQEGALTADAVIQALNKQAAAVDEQFGKIQATAGQAFVTLGNSITRAVGQIDEATGASSALAEGLISVSQYLDSGDLANGIIETMTIWRLSIGDTIDDLQDLGDQLGVLQTDGTDTVGFIVDAFKNLPANVTAFLRIMVVEVQTAFDKVQASAVAARDSFKAIFTDDTIDAAMSRRESRMETLNRVRDEAIGQIIREREQILSTAEVERKRREEERKGREQAAKDRADEIRQLREGAQGSSINLGGGNAAKEAEKAAKRLKDAYASTQADLQEQIALFGQTTEAARIRYAVENGELSKLDAKQKARLIDLAKELDLLGRKQEALEAQSRLARDFEQIQQSNMTALEQENAFHEQRLERLREYGEKNQELRGEVNEQIQREERRHQEELARIEEEANAKKFQILTEGQESALTATGQLFGNLAEIAAKGGKESFQSYKNLASAEAAIAGTLASIKALAAAPPPLNFALAASIGALTAAQIAQIQGQEYQGRANGGPVSAGTMYEVNERGPELLTVGGKDFLMMGNQKGHVTPNNQLGGGAQVTLINHSSTALKMRPASLDPNERRFVIEDAVNEAVAAVAAQMGNANSNIGRSMSRNYSVQRNR